MEKQRKQLLYWCREIPEVMETNSANAHKLWYQVALRCQPDGRLIDFKGRTISFATCAKKAGIKHKSSRSEALAELLRLGLVYKHPKGGGGICVDKVQELFEKVLAIRAQYGSVEANPTVYAGRTPEVAQDESSKSLNKKGRSAPRDFFREAEDSSNWMPRMPRDC